MLNNRSRGCLQNCSYSKQLSMALLLVSHPSAQACGGEDILFIFLIFLGHPEFWTPLQIPIWGPTLAAPCYKMSGKLLRALRGRLSLS